MQTGRRGAWCMGLLALTLASLMACSDNNEGASGDPDRSAGGGDGGVTSFDSPTCGYVEVDLEETTPTVMLLVDRSSTMGEKWAVGTDESRWQLVYDVLMSPAAAAEGGVVKRLQRNARFGLALYSSNQQLDSCPALTTVDPALNNYDAIDAVYSPVAVESWRDLDEADWHHTPTGEAMAQVHTSLAALPGDEPKVVILATDGLPDTCADPEADYGTAAEKKEARQLAIDAVAAAQADGIRTFVIGIADRALDRDHLQELANVGAGLPAEAEEGAPYFWVETREQLVASFGQITGQLTDCLLELSDPLSNIDDEELGTVTLDGKQAVHRQDWRLVNTQVLEVLGDSCAQLLAGEIQEVKASWPCRSLLY
jgi:hypothetical protein